MDCNLGDQSAYDKWSGKQILEKCSESSPVDPAGGFCSLSTLGYVYQVVSGEIPFGATCSKKNRPDLFFYSNK